MAEGGFDDTTPYSFFMKFCQNLDELEQNSNVTSATRTNSSWPLSTGITSGQSASPSGSGSPSNSTHSQCNTPEMAFDLHSILLNLVDDDIRIDNIQKRGTSPNNRCKDCTDRLCESCVIISDTAQLQNPASMFEKNPTSIFEQSIKITESPTNMLSTSSQTHVDRTKLYVPPIYCELHRDSQRFYCHTCSVTVCENCSIQQHYGHETAFYIDAVEDVSTAARYAVTESRVSLNILKDDMDAIQLAMDGLNRKAHQATTDVLLYIRKLVVALETREQVLLNKIENAKQQKMAILQARGNALKLTIDRLTNMSSNLNGDIQKANSKCNPLEISLSKDMVLSEVYKCRHYRQCIPTLEENWISFTGTDDNGVLSLLANVGNIVVNNPGHIGDRRMTRSRTAQQLPLAYLPIIPLVPIPRGRAVAGSNSPVVVTLRFMQLRQLSEGAQIIGENCDSADSLCRPWGITCDRDGNIIVADRSNNRIQIYNEDGIVIRRFGSHGTAPGQFNRPAGITIDKRRRLIVADKDNHRIQILTMEGTPILHFGEKGCSHGQFNYPWDVAANSDCQIVVSDTRNHRVQLFSAEGVFLRKYGYETSPCMWKHFDSPRGVSFNPEGNIIITDFNNHRVVILESDFSSLRPLIAEDKKGIKPFLRPQGVAVDDEGNIIVSDSRNHRVQVFNASGILMWSYGSYGSARGEMDRPAGVCVSSTSRIVVVDFGNNRVQIF